MNVCTSVCTWHRNDLRPVYSDTTQLNSTSSWVELRQRVAIDTSPTQLNSTRRRVELSCVAIDTLTDATQLSPTIGNATGPVEQRTANQRESGQSSWVELCRYKRAFRKRSGSSKGRRLRNERPSCVQRQSRDTDGGWKTEGYQLWFIGYQLWWTFLSGSLPLLYYFKVITTLYLLLANKISDLTYYQILKIFIHHL